MLSKDSGSPRSLNYIRLGRKRGRIVATVIIVATLIASPFLWHLTFPYIRTILLWSAIRRGSDVNPEAIAAVAMQLRLSSYSVVYSHDDSSRDTSWWCKIQIDKG